MQLFIDKAMLSAFEKSIKYYVEGKAKIGLAEVAQIALVTRFFNLLNDINLLLERKRFTSGYALMRTAFEIQVYLSYIFQDSRYRDRRSKAYFYSDYQKFVYYLKHADETSFMDRDEMLHQINTNKSELGKYESVNDYFNTYRKNFKSCLTSQKDPDPGLEYQNLSANDEFKEFKIDKRKWYNDDGKTSNFLALVQRLGLVDEYAALYVPTSDSVHSDGLRRNLTIEEGELAFVELFEPSKLAFFRGNILKTIEFLEKATADNTMRRKIKHERKIAGNAFLINYNHN